jgi:hypothetical protein
MFKAKIAERCRTDAISGAPIASGRIADDARGVVLGSATGAPTLVQGGACRTL